MLIGNVGKEPDVRYVATGVPTASLTLATNTPGYTLPGGTTVPERTEWHNVLLWRKLAETVERYVHKGDKLYIEGQLRTRSYTDRQGHTRYVTEVWAERMEMLTPRNASKPSADAAAPQAANGATPAAPTSTAGATQQVTNPTVEGCPF